jgi:hypothetical protein
VFKRATWFTAGVAVGAGGAAVGYIRVRQLARRHLPASVQDAAVRVGNRAADEAEVLAGRAVDTVDEWRAAAADAGEARRHAERLLRDDLRRAGL